MVVARLGRILGGFHLQTEECFVFKRGGRVAQYCRASLGLDSRGRLSTWPCWTGGVARPHTNVEVTGVNEEEYRN